jgi:hypothetical protein
LVRRNVIWLLIAMEATMRATDITN